MASKKRKTRHSEKGKVLLRWSVYITSILITIITISNIAVSFMENMTWDGNALFVFVLPTVLTMLGILTFIYLPWVWFSRSEINQDYMDFKNALVNLFGYEK